MGLSYRCKQLLFAARLFNLINLQKKGQIAPILRPRRKRTQNFANAAEKRGVFVFRKENSCNVRKDYHFSIHMNQKIEIVDYRPEYKDDFVRLN